MANQPAKDTESTSFTLPSQLFAALRRKAEAEMTNQSDIVRRALMNYLTPKERDQVLSEIAGGPAKPGKEKRITSYTKDARQRRRANSKPPRVPKDISGALDGAEETAGS